MAEEKKVTVSGSLLPSSKNTPLDVRSRINTIADVSKIQMPFVGLIFYVLDEEQFYVVKSLKSKQVAGIDIANALIDEYELLNDTKTTEQILDVIIDQDKDGEVNKAIWENVQELMESDNIVEGIQKILEGKQQEEILGITADDIGKVLMIDKDEETGEAITKAIHAAFFSNQLDISAVEYKTNKQPEVETLKGALDFLFDKYDPEAGQIVSFNWDQIVGKPEVIADGLVLTEEALILKDDEEDISSVPLVTDEDVNNILGSLSD